MKMNLVAAVFVAFAVTAGIAAETQPCTLKQENAQCKRNSECCSRCCTAGLCSSVGSCFPACDPSRAATVEGPAVCRLTKSIDELTDLLKIMINSDLETGIPVLANIIRTVNVFFKDPISGIAFMPDVIEGVHKLGNMFNTTMDETRLIINDVSDIIDTSVHLMTKLINSH